MSFLPSKKTINNNFKRMSAQSLENYETNKAAVAGAFDFKALKRICGLNELKFDEYAIKFDVEPAYKWAKRTANGRFYYFQDNGADLLAVAHLDSVQGQRFCKLVSLTNKEADDGFGGKVIFSPVLDDRLGAYTILELLPKLGLKYDILLTTDEEVGMTTAADFELEAHGIAPGRYKWMFQFDRAETDAVFYQYGTAPLMDGLEAAGWDIGRGIYSDISAMEHIGCCGVNFGVGYTKYHSIDAQARLSDYVHNVARFLCFFKEHEDTAFAWTAPVMAKYGIDRDSYEGYDSYKYDWWSDSAKEESYYRERDLENVSDDLLASWADSRNDHLTPSGQAGYFTRADIQEMWEYGELYTDDVADYMDDTDWQYAGWLDYCMEQEERKEASRGGYDPSIYSSDGDDMSAWTEPYRARTQNRIPAKLKAPLEVTVDLAKAACELGGTFGDHYSQRELEDMLDLLGADSETKVQAMNRAINDRLAREAAVRIESEPYRA